MYNQHECITFTPKTSTMRLFFSVNQNKMLEKELTDFEKPVSSFSNSLSS